MRSKTNQCYHIGHRSHFLHETMSNGCLREEVEAQSDDSEYMGPFGLIMTVLVTTWNELFERLSMPYPYEYESE